MEGTCDPWHRANAIRALEEGRNCTLALVRTNGGRGWNRETVQYIASRDGKRVPRENVLPACFNLLKQRRISQMVGGEHVGSAWLGADSITGCLIRLSVSLECVHRQAWFPLTHTVHHCTMMLPNCVVTSPPGGKGRKRGIRTMIAGSNFISTCDITTRPQIRNLIGTNEHFQFTDPYNWEDSMEMGGGIITKVPFVKNISLYIGTGRVYICTHIYIQILFIRARYIRRDVGADRSSAPR